LLPVAEHLTGNKIWSELQHDLDPAKPFAPFEVSPSLHDSWFNAASEALHMQDFEKMGAFYLGKTYDTNAGKLNDELLMYDSQDLTTHAVIIGMTGSGKTGLGIGLLEEALVDNIPVIAIDPKGDLCNLLLSFPDLSSAEFKPWVNLEEAARQGLNGDTFAAQQAELWKKGLGDWGQDSERIRRMRSSVTMAIYTPGASHGLQVSVLKSFDVPPTAVMEDSDALRERIQTSASGLLGLLGIDADPIRSREHILLSNIFSSAWAAGTNLDLGALIQAIQTPSFEKIGVMNLESFYPGKERFELAMQLNNLLASPGFSSWMEGEPLDIQKMMYTPEGKPRLTVFSIAHLGDAERMFFVSMLMNNMLGWMRSQSGTSSLRAVLYMDEIFGYFPPNGNPPSKTPILTLLKQARAFGLGLVLATQNPVDLDYKGLANTGTWFIGRLQTENDKARVLEALSGAMTGSTPMSQSDLDKMLSSLGKRVFLMHNVHESHPVTFQTRWTMSYLAGPMTGPQIKTLMMASKKLIAASTASNAVKSPSSNAIGNSGSGRPMLPPNVTQYFVPSKLEGATYYPFVLGAAQARFSSPKYKIDTARTMRLIAEIGDGPVPIRWDEAQLIELELDALESEPVTPSDFADLPSPGSDAKNYAKWEKDFGKWVAQTQALVLYESKANKSISEPDESEGDFRARLAHHAREGRDDLKARLREKYAGKLSGLQDKLARAMQKREQEAAQANQKKLEAVVNVGMGVLGALFGGGRRTTVSAASRAVKSASQAFGQQGDVGRADDTVEAIQAQLNELNTQLEAELTALEAGNPDEALEEVRLKPKSTDINLELLVLAWVPYTRANGKLEPAY
jgi:Helicase HerA, central domain